MNCETTHALFSDYYDGGLGAGERVALEEHLRGCETCTTEYRHFTHSLGVLHETRPMETTALFLSNVRAAAQQHVERREKLLRTTSEAITLATPLARPLDARPGAGPLPAWVPWALSAAVVLAFAAGALLFRGRSPDPAEDEARLNRLLQEALAKRPPVRVAVEKPVDVDRLLAERGLVQVDGEWIPRKLKEDFERGLVVVSGRPMTREEAAALLAREFPPKAAATPAPPPLTPVPTLDEILDRAGYVRINELPVPKAWIEKWGDGLVQTGPNEWKKASVFREELIREHNLVEFRGKLMSREQADSLQAQMLVRAPATATAVNELTRRLDGLQIGPPMHFRRVTVYPLLAERPPAPGAFSTLHTALGNGKVEVSDSLGLYSVQARNAGEQDLLLLQGELLVGGRCARIVAEDAVVPRGGTARVPVLCAEPAGWRAGERFAKESGHYVAPPFLRRSAAWEQGQGALWALLGRSLGGRPGLAELFRKQSEGIAEARSYLAALADREPQAVGLAVAIGDAVEWAELFRDRGLFLEAFDRVLAGAFLEAFEREGVSVASPSAAPAAVQNSVRGVKDLLEAAFFHTYEAKEDGVAVRRDDATVGRLRADGGELTHAVLFAAGAPEWERKTSPVIPRDKARKAIDDAEARMKPLGPSRKIAVLRDLATIQAPDVVVALSKHLGETDLAVRRAVVQELGASGDARATDALLQVLVRSREEPTLYVEAVKALAKLGDERSVEPFLRQLDLGGEGDLDRSILQSLPELLLQARSRDVIERSTLRLVTLFESAEAASKGDVIADPFARNLRPPEAKELLETLRSALLKVAGIEFSTPAGARKWWNDREARERFLRERTGK